LVAEKQSQHMQQLLQQNHEQHMKQMKELKEQLQVKQHVQQQLELSQCVCSGTLHIDYSKKIDCNADGYHHGGLFVCVNERLDPTSCTVRTDLLTCNVNELRLADVSLLLLQYQQAVMRHRISHGECDRCSSMYRYLGIGEENLRSNDVLQLREAFILLSSITDHTICI